MSNNIPIVGKGATIAVGSDYYAYEVIEVSKDNKKCILKEYNATPVDGFDYYSNQEYTYDKLHENTTELVWRNGAWRKKCSRIEFKNYDALNKEQIASCFNEAGIMILNEYTVLKHKYSNVNVRFGYKRFYQDPSF